MITFLLGCLGVYILYFRLQKFEVPTFEQKLPNLLSVIIPARNEEKRLPVLLESLKNIKNIPLEIIVVNDQSSDKTAEVATTFGCKLVEAPGRPEGWTGKSWACHYGAKFASSDLILFTDADTRFFEKGLSSFIKSHLYHQLDMSCPMIFHRSRLWWEYLIGAFHLLYLLGTNFNGRASIRRLYANGQCLLFRQDFYVENSHFEIKEDLAEDMALAKRCLEFGGKYQVYSNSIVYDVQMFSDFKSFYRGWHRIFRLGLKHTSIQASLEITLVVIAMLGGGKWLFGFPELLLVIVSGFFVYKNQKLFGEFSGGGILLLPFTILLFTWISVHAVISNTLGNSYIWRGRNYNTTSKS